MNISRIGQLFIDKNMQKFSIWKTFHIVAKRNALIIGVLCDKNGKLLKSRHDILLKYMRFYSADYWFARSFSSSSMMASASREPHRR